MSWSQFQAMLVELRVSEGEMVAYQKYAQDYYGFIEGRFYSGSTAEYINALIMRQVSSVECELADRSIQILLEAFNFKVQVTPFSGSDQTVQSQFRLFNIELEARRLRKNTIKNYNKWLKRFFQFLNLHSDEILPSSDALASQLKPFLSDLSIHFHVSKSTQQQALSALNFYFKNVLRYKIEDTSFIKSRRVNSLPEVLTQQEVKLVLSRCAGVWNLFFSLMYGCGFRLSEILNLRYKDVRIDVNRIMVFDSKGGKNRSVLIPHSLVERLKIHKRALENLYTLDSQANQQEVDVPLALARKDKSLAFSLEWQYVFVNKQLMKHPMTSQLVRFHYHPDTVRKNLKRMTKNLSMNKKIHPHIFRHSYATHSLENGVTIAELKESMGHSDIKTTMTYLHVKISEDKQQSPLDFL